MAMPDVVGHRAAHELLTQLSDMNDECEQLRAIVRSLATHLGAISTLLPLHHQGMRRSSHELAKAALRFLDENANT